MSHSVNANVNLTLTGTLPRALSMIGACGLGVTQGPAKGSHKC